MTDGEKPTVTGLLRKPVTFVVDWSWRHCRLVALLFLLLSGGLGWVAVSHLTLDTDQSHMISPNLPYRLAEQALDDAFPQSAGLLVVVVDGPTSAATDAAVDQLQARLEPRHDLFRLVRRPPEDLFFRAHGLMFLSDDELTALSDRMVAAQPLIGTLARDPSLRGFLDTIGLAEDGLAHGQADQQTLAPLLQQLDRPAAAIAAGQSPPPVDWPSLFGALAEHDQPRRILMTQPKLSFEALEAGQDATQAIRNSADILGLTAANGFRVRLTGSVALADANFATVTEGTAINAPLMLLAVVVLIYIAVKSLRIVAAIMLSLIAGLALTLFFGVATVGSLNPISVAFGVMFVGIAVDFAIQFVVRFRDEQEKQADIADAMRSAAAESAAPLTLAAIATAVGFLSFVPTDYTGVSQLGLIAGGGMVIALLVDFTLLPALLALWPPAPLTASMSLPWAAGDRWLAKHDLAVVIVAGLAALIGLALTPILPIDFNPLHLQSQKSEPVATFYDLAKNPDNGVFAVDLLTAPERATAAESRCGSHPEILRCLSLADFVPGGQDDKLAILADLKQLLGSTLSPASTLPPPDVATLRADLIRISDRLGDSPTALHLRQVAAMDDRAVLALQQAVTDSLPELLQQLRQMLDSEKVTAAMLPPALVADWQAADGRKRVEVFPKGDMELAAPRAAFVAAVAALDGGPAAGAPVSVEQSGKVVVRAFLQAGLAALAAIFVMLWLLLRRVRDALMVLLPLLIGVLLTVIGCVVSGLAINYANIIALPLLLGVGVAFNIYFVINWRKGVTTPLQSATTRAVLYSALTTGCAFGSLAVSPHLGTASMGLLLFLSLGLSVGSTFIVLPALFCLITRLRDKPGD